MTELTIMELIDRYRNGELHDTADLIDNIYDTCERAVAQQEAELFAQVEAGIAAFDAWFDQYEAEQGTIDYPESHEWEA